MQDHSDFLTGFPELPDYDCPADESDTNTTSSRRELHCTAHPSGNAGQYNQQ